MLLTSLSSEVGVGWGKEHMSTFNHPTPKHKKIIIITQFHGVFLIFFYLWLFFFIHPHQLFHDHFDIIVIIIPKPILSLCQMFSVFNTCVYQIGRRFVFPNWQIPIKSVCYLLLSFKMAVNQKGNNVYLVSLV